MASFTYVMKDVKGVRVEGVVKGSTLDEVVEKLTKEGGTIISVKAADQKAVLEKMSMFEKVMLAFYKWRTGISLKVLVFFTRQLATMFSAGLTIEKAIENLANEEKNNKFKKVLAKVNIDIRKGFSLSESLEQHPGVFNPLYVSLVKAGEVSGTLHTVLDELAIYLEKLDDTRRKVSSAMSYPIFILVFLILVVLFIFYKVIPMFAGVYERFNADLPIATQVAIRISDVVSNHFIATVGGIILFVFVMFLIYLTDRGRYVMDKFVLSLPVIGQVVCNSIISKFSRTFSILMAAGVPIMDTMELVENVVQNAVFESAVRKSRVMVKEGYSIAAAFKKTKAFPPTMIQLTATGEETGDMDRLLAKAAEFYEKLVDSVIERLTSLIEPLLIILIAATVGGLIVVIYIPVFKLGLAISDGMK